MKVLLLAAALAVVAGGGGGGSGLDASGVPQLKGASDLDALIANANGAPVFVRFFMNG